MGVDLRRPESVAAAGPDGRDPPPAGSSNGESALIMLEQLDKVNAKHPDFPEYERTTKVCMEAKMLVQRKCKEGVSEDFPLYAAATEERRLKSPLRDSTISEA